VVITRPTTLYTLRQEAGLSIRALAALSGVDKAIISQVERGRLIALPAEADRIAAALGLPAGTLHTRMTLVYYDGAA
jgi:transcriptional regulator with XRE-family HTH domain